MTRLLDWRFVTVAILSGISGAAFLIGCASAPSGSTKKRRTPAEPGDDYFSEDVPSEQGLTPSRDPDSGAFGASERPAAVGPSDAGPQVVDGGASDGGPLVKTFCDGALKAGDLQITELMIASRAGAGDDGEWVEIRSTRTCWLQLKGLAIESPRGTALDSVTIADAFELGPRAFFLVADSADAAKNHGLPGKLFAWNAADVLKNDGDTVSLKLGATVVDTLTYPAFSNLEPGRSVAFPDDCPSNVRFDWARWSLTFTAWRPGFRGTPSAPNNDVACY